MRLIRDDIVQRVNLLVKEIAPSVRDPITSTASAAARPGNARTSTNPNCRSTEMITQFVTQ
jgi:hypothetical protein